jgi:hypothetical protein
MSTQPVASSDVIQAFAFSRPPAIATGYYDVRPYMDEATTPESDCEYFLSLHICLLSCDP